MKTKIQCRIFQSHVCLYPTFKEWKPIYAKKDNSKSSVYILPLRNENEILSKISSIWSFSLYPTFEEWFDAWLMANSAGEKWTVRSD